MGKLKKIAVGLLKAALMIIFVGGALIGGSMFFVFHANPKVMYGIYFETPIGLAHDFSGGGVSWMGHQAHLRFESDQEFHLTNPEKYSTGDPVQTAQFFLTFYPRDRASLEDTRNLT